MASPAWGRAVRDETGKVGRGHAVWNLVSRVWEMKHIGWKGSGRSSLKSNVVCQERENDDLAKGDALCQIKQIKEGETLLEIIIATRRNGSYCNKENSDSEILKHLHGRAGKISLLQRGVNKAGKNQLWASGMNKGGGMI